MKKYLIYILLFTTLLCGCSKNEIGTIQKNKDSDPIILNDISNSNLFTQIKNTSGVKTSLLIDNVAEFTIQYPSEWKVYSTANQTTFTNDDAEIIIDHNLRTQSDSSLGKVDTFIKGFDILLENETFNLGEYQNFYRNDIQKPSTIKTISEESEKVLISQTFEPIRLKDGQGSNLLSEASEKRYYLRYNNIDTIITAVCFNDNKDAVFNLLDYMVSTIQTNPVKYDSSIKVDTDTDTITLPNTMKKSGASISGLTGTCYQAPDNDPLCGSFVQIYPLEKNLPINSEIAREAFTQAFPKESLLNSYKMIEGEYCFESALKNITSQAMAGVTIEKKYDSTSILKDTNYWNMEFYELGNSDSTCLVIVGYPNAKSDLIKSLSEK